MIVRIWQGWTTPENADVYETLLRNEIFPDIQAKTIPGLQSIELLRLEHAAETEFMTLFRFDSVEDIESMTGEDAEAAYVPAIARKVLHRYEERARHFVRRYESTTRRNPR